MVSSFMSRNSLTFRKVFMSKQYPEVTVNIFQIFQDDDIVKTLRSNQEYLEVHGCGLRGNNQKMEQGKLSLAIRIIFITTRMVKY